MANDPDFVIEEGVLLLYMGSGGDVAIPESVRSIMHGVFQDCTKLTSVIIPGGVTSIGESAFQGCTKLTSVIIPGSVTSIRESAFQGCTKLTSVIIPESVTSIGIWAFRDTPWLNGSGEFPFLIFNHRLLEYQGNDVDVIIPESVTEIGTGAFCGCAGLTSVAIPESIAEISRGTFCGCTGLTSVTIPEGVTEIGWRAFYHCTGLTSAIIPESVTKIGEGAFSYCGNLQSVTILAGTTKIDKSVFEGCRPMLIAPHMPVSSFDKADKPGACRGFARLYLDGAELDEEIKAGYLKYIKSQRKRLCPLAVQHEELLRLMLAEKMFPRKDVDILLAECDNQNNEAAKAAVQDYINTG